LGKRNPYRCKEFHRYGHLGGDDVINIDGSSQKEREDNPTFLFSTKPFRNETWESKGLSETDSTDLTELLSKGSNRFKVYRDAVSLQRARAVRATSSRVTLYVIPEKKKVVEEYSSTHKHLLVLRTNGQLSIKGEIGAAPRRYTDVNGDGIPEIVVALNCDGNCWELFDVSRRIKSLASMSDH